MLNTLSLTLFLYLLVVFTMWIFLGVTQVTGVTVLNLKDF